MKIELKRLKVYPRMSDETLAFVADVWVDGKKVGTAKNDGHGGQTMVDVPPEIRERMVRFGESTITDGVRWSSVDPDKPNGRTRVSITASGAKRFGLAAGTTATISRVIPKERVTADTITAEQIRELRAAFPMAMEDEFSVDANGERGPVGDRIMRESRVRCAELYNQRLSSHVKVETDRSVRGASASFTCEWPTTDLQPTLVDGGDVQLVDRLVEQHENDKQAAKISKIDTKEVLANAKRGMGTLRWTHTTGSATNYTWVGLRKGDDPAKVADAITKKRGVRGGEIAYKVLSPA